MTKPLRFILFIVPVMYLISCRIRPSELLEASAETPAYPYSRIETGLMPFDVLGLVAGVGRITYSGRTDRVINFFEGANVFSWRSSKEDSPWDGAMLVRDRIQGFFYAEIEAKYYFVIVGSEFTYLFDGLTMQFRHYFPTHIEFLKDKSLYRLSERIFTVDFRGALTIQKDRWMSQKMNGDFPWLRQPPIRFFARRCPDAEGLANFYAGSLTLGNVFEYKQTKVSEYPAPIDFRLVNKATFEDGLDFKNIDCLAKEDTPADFSRLPLYYIRKADQQSTYYTSNGERVARDRRGNYYVVSKSSWDLTINDLYETQMDLWWNYSAGHVFFRDKADFFSVEQFESKFIISKISLKCRLDKRLTPEQRRACVTRTHFSRDFNLFRDSRKVAYRSTSNYLVIQYYGNEIVAWPLDDSSAVLQFPKDDKIGTMILAPNPLYISSGLNLITPSGTKIGGVFLGFTAPAERILVTGERDVVAAYEESFLRLRLKPKPERTPIIINIPVEK